jgi:hypothetical protein
MTAWFRSERPDREGGIGRGERVGQSVPVPVKLKQRRVGSPAGPRVIVPG